MTVIFIVFDAQYDILNGARVLSGKYTYTRKIKTLDDDNNTIK